MPYEGFLWCEYTWVIRPAYSVAANRGSFNVIHAVLMSYTTDCTWVRCLLQVVNGQGRTSSAGVISIGSATCATRDYVLRVHSSCFQPRITKPAPCNCRLGPLRQRRKYSVVVVRFDDQRRPVHTLALDCGRLRQERFISLLCRLTTGCATMQPVPSRPKRL